MAAITLACLPAWAQTSTQLPGFELERLATNVGRGSLLMGNGELMVPGGLNVTLLGHYQYLPLVLNDGIQDLRVVENRATAQLSASYGLLPWLELGAQVPFVLWQDGADPSTLGLSRLSAQGLGTPVVQARLGLLTRRYQQPVDLSADVGVGLPIGTSAALAGDAGPRIHARMVVGTVIGNFQPALEAGVLFRPAILLSTSDGLAKPGARAEVRVGAALSTMGKGLRGEVGVRTTLAPQVSMDVLGGVRFPLLVGLDAFILAGPSVGGAVGTPRVRALLGVNFGSEPPPRIRYLDAQADQALQIVLATPTLTPDEERVQPTRTWELGSLMRADNPVGGAVQESVPLKPLPPYQPGAQERLVLRGAIPFTRGSTTLPGVVPLLDQAALRLAEQARTGLILVEGHADSEGLADSTDARLSLQRAQAIRRYLIEQGIPASQVRIRGLGSAWPVSDAPATEQERALNRRAEVLVLSAPSQEPLTTQSAPP